MHYHKSQIKNRLLPKYNNILPILTNKQCALLLVKNCFRPGCGYYMYCGFGDCRFLWIVVGLRS